MTIKPPSRPPSAPGGLLYRPPVPGSGALPLPPGLGGGMPAANAELDVLLEQVAATLQLTATQFDRAKSAYGSVTDWLAAEGSPLAHFEPTLFPQGSAALLTTTRPIGASGYDVDLVCRLLRTGWTAMQVYQVVWDRLAAHGVYSSMLEAKERCIRLNYKTEAFHLDVVVAEPSPLLGNPHAEHAIRIVDCGIQNWTSSNPRGYALWFNEQAETARVLKEARDVAPLPRRLTEAQNTVLATVVQLVKRSRDLKFSDSRRTELAPRSIILTTLAAMVYDGDQSTARALYGVVTRIAGMVRAAWPQRLVVVNPTNANERFCDKFTAESYTAFVNFIVELEAEVVALARQQGGLPDYRPRLDALFGSEPVQKAMLEYGTRLQKAASEGRLRASSASGLFVTGAGPAQSTIETAGRAVPKHRFFGASANVLAGSPRGR